MSDYWGGLLRRRISRRRALAVSGATALSAAFLAACGGDSDKGVAGDSSGLVSKAVDTTKQAKPGGIWQSSFDREQAHIDPNTNNASAALISWVTPLYSLLLKYGFGMSPDAAAPEAITGDAAESWELAPDGAQITLRLRQNHTFDPRPPTTGRAMTAADVKFSWDRFVAGGSFASDIVQSKNPVGPIESLSTPDDRTVVVKLAFPYGLITEVLAFQSYFFIAPREFEGGFNSRTEARGSGPWLLEKWEPSVSFDLRRNPNWYVKGRPFLDAWSRKIVPEYATGLAQFEAGSLWDFSVRAEDILRVKRGHPEMVMLRNFDSNNANRSGLIAFCMHMSQRDDSIYKDVRVRRAFSMLIDREAYIDAFYNVSGFRREGLPIETYWHSQIAALANNWIDPRDKAIGEGGKYFEHNVDEAKKQLSAAGALGAPVEFIRSNTSYVKEGDVIAAMLVDGGLDPKTRVVDHNTEYRSIQATRNEGHTGTIIQPNGGYNDEAFLVNKYTPAGQFRISNKPIEGITDAVQKARRELDGNKRDEMIRQIQRDLAVLMPDVSLPGVASTLSLRWPWLKNEGVFFNGGASARVSTEAWYDESARKKS